MASQYENSFDVDRRSRTQFQYRQTPTGESFDRRICCKYFITDDFQLQRFTFLCTSNIRKLHTVKLPFQSSRVIFLGRSPAEEHLPGIIQAKECMKKKKHISMVSLNLPPAPLRKGNIQAVDLHHSIGLSATPSSL